MEGHTYCLASFNETPSPNKGYSSLASYTSGRYSTSWILTVSASLIHDDWQEPQFSSVVQLCPTLCDPMDGACQVSLSITNSWSLLRLMSIKSVMPFNHLIFCHPLLLLPSIFSSIRVFSRKLVLCIRWPKDWSFSISPSWGLPFGKVK